MQPQETVAITPEFYACKTSRRTLTPEKTLQSPSKTHEHSGNALRRTLKLTAWIPPPRNTQRRPKETCYKYSRDTLRVPPDSCGYFPNTLQALWKCCRDPTEPLLYPKSHCGYPSKYAMGIKTAKGTPGHATGTFKNEERRNSV